MGSNPATPTIFPNDFNGWPATRKADEMSGKRPVSRQTESPSQPMRAPEAPGKWPGAGEIESLRNSLLAFTERDEVPDPSIDVLTSAQVGIRNSSKRLLRDNLYELFAIINKIEDSRDVAAIYDGLNSIILAAIMIGNFDESVGLSELRKEMKEAEVRSKRKANIAAQERRDRILPLVCDAAKLFPKRHSFKSLATQIYKKLKDHPEFVAAMSEADQRLSSIAKSKKQIPKGLSPRQVKEDIEAILIALDRQAEMDGYASLLNFDASS